MYQILIFFKELVESVRAAVTKVPLDFNPTSHHCRIVSDYLLKSARLI